MKKLNWEKNRDERSWMVTAKSWSQTHKILSRRYVAAPQSILVCLTCFGISPFGNKFKVYEPRRPSSEEEEGVCVCKLLTVVCTTCTIGEISTISLFTGTAKPHISSFQRIHFAHQDSQNCFMPMT